MISGNTELLSLQRASPRDLGTLFWPIRDSSLVRKRQSHACHTAVSAARRSEQSMCVCVFKCVPEKEEQTHAGVSSIRGASERGCGLRSLAAAKAVGKPDR